MINVHEEQFVRAFIVPEKQDRYLDLLRTEKGADKDRFGFDHRNELELKFATRIPKPQQTVTEIKRLLGLKGAPARCYVLSSNPFTDEQERDLLEALEETVGQGMGSLISCIPGKLAYFEFEDPGERYILERK